MFDGECYDPKYDKTRLLNQLGRVYDCMIGGTWRTLEEIASITRDPEASISAQLRHLRKERFGSYIVDKKRRGSKSLGLWEYKLITPKKEGSDSMDIDKVVASYVACRDHLAEVRKEFKEIELEHKSQMAIMETAIMEEADRQGVESFKTKHGTAFKTKKDWISPRANSEEGPGWDEALAFMIANDLTHMLTKSVGKAAAKEYMDEHDGALPPGLIYGYKPTISIRRK